jgi:hypothetical protein
LLAWALYAALVLLWQANGGSFAPGDRVAGPLLILGAATSLGLGLGSGLLTMKMVRRNSLEKWQGLLAVLLSSAASAIAPPMILAMMPSPERKAAWLSAAVLSFATLTFGAVAFVAFGIGILSIRARASPTSGLSRQEADIP